MACVVKKALILIIMMKMMMMMMMMKTLIIIINTFPRSKFASVRRPIKFIWKGESVKIREFEFWGQLEY